MALSDQEVKHLELLQAAIARIAGNSSNLKAWTVTVLAGIFALSAKDADRRFVAIAIAPAVGFWALDAYYLTIERRHRRLYDAVRRQEHVEPFCMDTSAHAATHTYRSALFSVTLRTFYGVITIFVFILAVIVF